MATLIGMANAAAVAELERRGWEIETPHTESLPPPRSPAVAALRADVELLLRLVNGLDPDDGRWRITWRAARKLQREVEQKLARLTYGPPDDEVREPEPPPNDRKLVQVWVDQDLFPFLNTPDCHEYDTTQSFIDAVLPRKKEIADGTS